jgi:Pyridoxamine 5'-phosphate oxidase
MTPEEDLGGMARQIVDTIMYMTLATADQEGRPWASPVWYASATYTEWRGRCEAGARLSRPQLTLEARAFPVRAR